MAIQTRPAADFDDVKTVLGPKAAAPRRLFERAGFTKVVDTDSVLDGFSSGHHETRLELTAGTILPSVSARSAGGPSPL